MNFPQYVYKMVNMLVDTPALYDDKRWIDSLIRAV
jgi:hypothetical protein